MKKFCLFITCALLALSSCKKKTDEVDTSTASVNVALLTTKPWIIASTDNNP
ncbi:MAG: hypothetical protein V4592_22315 [Bacteroidota bacterium]